MKNKFNNLFQDIKVSKELDNNIYNKTIYKKGIPRIYIIKPIIVILFVFIFLGVGVMAKDYIENYIFQTHISKSKGEDSTIDLNLNGKVKIEQNSSFICKDDITHQEIEKKLNIKLLKFKHFNKYDYNICDSTLDNKGNIRILKLQNDDNFSEYDLNNKELRDKKYLQIDITFMTQYANNKDEQEFQNISIIKGPSKFTEFIETYHIKKINLDVNIVKWSTNKYWPQTFCYFVYNDIFYNIQGYNISYDELIDILNNLEL